MTIVIRRLRMSLSWSAPFTTLIQDNPPSDAPLLALGKRESYKQLFNILQAASNETEIFPPSTVPTLELPWEPLKPNIFWIRYLKATPASLRRTQGGSLAFDRLVPLRRHAPLTPKLVVTFKKKHVVEDKVILQLLTTEAWFHPHMVSFAIHFTICGAMSLETAATVCLGLRHDRLLSWGGSSSPFNVDELAAEMLDKLYIEAVGESNAGVLEPVNPFSLVTVLQGGGVDPDEVIINGGSVHRFLENVTQWDLDAGNEDPVDKGRINSKPVRNPPNITGPLLFGPRRSRARAVWEPRHFLPTGDGKPSLSSYHRNLIMSSLQTEALLAFARLASEQAAVGHLPQTIRDCERFVLTRLVAIHKGDKLQNDTYCSINLQRIIDDSRDRESVDAIADRLISRVRLPPRIFQGY
ncbi:MAG: hypothetical protein Q8N35_17090 [Methylococcaceae bacterium]|nr:hypothetical protein [Methylococcaceae bacterium]MDZ4157923.1 hypothetical protein [Methylococcales bacterium]MDP2393429.1 hypothetical protein [Methylococcaceae bacterium]MDP3021299.1 hypothetical protein [Methylococcaceae bacterium]MDP3392021.1 hypothetical protein [Methylococcaceae bacterium]